MIVRFSTPSKFISGVCCCDDEVGHVDGWEVAASRACVSVGVCVPEPAVDGALDGAREEMVWLSRVRRREVMMTCGTWYVLWRTCIAAARDLRSVIGVSESNLRL